MNRDVIPMALSIVPPLVCAIALLGLGGCSEDPGPRAEAVKKAFSKRFADSGDLPRGKRKGGRTEGSKRQ